MKYVIIASFDSRQQKALPRPFCAPPVVICSLRLAVLHLGKISEFSRPSSSVTKPQTRYKICGTGSHCSWRPSASSCDSFLIRFIMSVRCLVQKLILPWYWYRISPIYHASDGLHISVGGLPLVHVDCWVMFIADS